MMARQTKTFPSQKPVAPDLVEALRQRVADFKDRTGYSWGDIAEQAGYGRTNDGKVCNFASGGSSIRQGRFNSMTEALDRYPAGWPEPSGRVFGVKVCSAPRAATQISADSVVAAKKRTEHMRAQCSPDGVPSPLNREAWERYWIGRESVGLDGRKHRATPLSRQVA
jgi:hypothetical protein